MKKHLPAPGTPEFDRLTPGKKSWATKAHTGQYQPKAKPDTDRYRGLVPHSQEWYTAVANRAVETRRANAAADIAAAIQSGKQVTVPPALVQMVNALLPKKRKLT